MSWHKTKQHTEINRPTNQWIFFTEINNVIRIKMAFHIQYIFFPSLYSFTRSMFESHLLFKYFKSAGEFVNCSFLLLNETRKWRRRKTLRCEWDLKCGFQKTTTETATAATIIITKQKNKHTFVKIMRMPTNIYIYIVISTHRFGLCSFVLFLSRLHCGEKSLSFYLVLFHSVCQIAFANKQKKVE